MGYNEIDDYGEEVDNQKEAYNYFIDTLLYYSRLFEGNIPNIDSVLDLEYFIYYDIIVKQVKLKKQEEERRKSEERRMNNKR